MSISLRIEPRGRLVVFQAIDAVMPTDWDRAIGELVAHRNFQVGCPILVDRRQEDAADRAWSLQRMVELLDHYAPVLRRSRWGMVVDRTNTAGYRVAQTLDQFQSIRKLEIDLFASVEPAIRWLLGDQAPWTTLAEVSVWAIRTATVDRFVANRLLASVA